LHELAIPLFTSHEQVVVGSFQTHNVNISKFNPSASWTTAELISFWSSFLAFSLNYSSFLNGMLLIVVNEGSKQMSDNIVPVNDDTSLFGTFMLIFFLFFSLV
jgi:hypothetical protein